MDAAGVDLVRAADPELEEAAGEHRSESLDENPAPNTAPAEYAEMETFERDAAPGDHGDVRLVNPVEDPTWSRGDAAPAKRAPKRKER
jgi:hypothetical protein